MAAASSVNSRSLIVCFLILMITAHQLGPLAMAAPGSKHALPQISSVGRAGNGIIAGGSTSGLGGGGGKKPKRVTESRGFRSGKSSSIGVGGSTSKHGGGGEHRHG